MKISVCKGSSCKENGSKGVRKEIEKLLEKYDLEKEAHVETMSCQGRCKKGICVKIHGEKYACSPDETREFFETHILEACRKK